LIDSEKAFRVADGNETGVMMRKSNLFLVFIAINLCLFCLMFLHAFFQERADLPLLNQKAELVKRLELTDLCLFTEARYTRHPSQADLNTPFQDHPLSLEHFPAGSLLGPPEGVKRRYEKLD
jgi:hypothetical protein